jgi:hypothetical protein
MFHSIQMKSLKSEVAFRRYEPLIAEILQRFPAEIRLSLPGFSPATIESRIREAAKGHMLYEYSSLLVDRQTFLELWPRVRITQDDQGCVARCVGSQQLVQTESKPTIESTKAWNSADIRALCHLISAGHITERIEVLTSISDDELQDILDGYDVAPVKENGKLYLL